MNRMLFLGLLLAGVWACSPSENKEIRLNQLGYYPHQEKVAVVESADVENFMVTDATTGEEVLSGKAAYVAANSWSAKKNTVIDFSALNIPGKYVLNIDGGSAPFEVKENVLAPLATAALKSFYLQRTGMAIEAEYAGQWHRPVGHPDTCVRIHPSAVGPKRKASDVISSPKGWYDAGDYNKYIVNSGYSIGLMQAIYRLFPDYFARQNVGIPESGNSTPDFLDEMYYNLSWMLTMQDPSDGGVYHKLTTPSFEAFIKPTECKQQRYVVQKSVTAALDFAASMAQASMLFAPYEKDYPGFAQQALNAARRAYDWAALHPDAYYKQNALNEEYDPDVLTGEYGDNDNTDEFFWAASELYYATGDKEYRDKAVQCVPTAYTAPSWGSTSPLGCFVWLLPGRELSDEADKAFAGRLKSLLLAYADASIEGADSSSFHAPYGDEEKDFFWGCLSEQCANQGTSLVYAYLLSGNESYLKNAYRNMDYLLGRNATGYCYVTGFGTKSPMHPHHRLSASDDVAEPLPGFLVGGPNPGQQDKLAYPSAEPDQSYIDDEASYASNEIAINWSAGLVALSSVLDALAGR